MGCTTDFIECNIKWVIENRVNENERRKTYNIIDNQSGKKVWKIKSKELLKNQLQVAKTIEDVRIRERLFVVNVKNKHFENGRMNYAKKIQNELSNRF